MCGGGGGSETGIVLPRALGPMRLQEQVQGGKGALSSRELLCRPLSRNSPATASQRNEAIEKLHRCLQSPLPLMRYCSVSLALPGSEDRVEEGSVLLAGALGGPFQNQVSCTHHIATGCGRGWRESAGVGQ